MRENVTAIETALNDAESAAEGLPEGAYKDAVVQSLAAVHAFALERYQFVVAAFPDEIAEGGIALRSGGHDKD